MNWKEMARDLRAFGSIPFYAIVLVRAVIGPYWIFIYQMVIAAAILAVISYIFKELDNHVARSLILVVFTSLFYKAPPYTLFALVLYAFIILASYYIGISRKRITGGIILGIASSFAAFYMSPAVLNLAL